MAHRAGTQIRFLFQIYSPMYQHTPQGVNTCCIINVTLRVLCTTNGTYTLQYWSYTPSENLRVSINFSFCQSYSLPAGLGPGLGTATGVSIENSISRSYSRYRYRSRAGVSIKISFSKTYSQNLYRGANRNANRYHPHPARSGMRIVLICKCN